MSRALSLLAAFASPVFMVAAIAGWLYEVWPANPLTFGVAALLVVGGPVLGLVHVATAKDLWGREAPAPAARRVAPPARVAAPAPLPLTARAAAPAPLPLTARAAAARRFAKWRESPHPALELRERERRVARHLRG
ncbi:MAG TPA: hypothetical protein VNS09_22875 [Solirubrobacter sp.]|nr:hypothetical protein [Solirubrobacter sp.]